MLTCADIARPFSVILIVQFSSTLVALNVCMFYNPCLYGVAKHLHHITIKEGFCLCCRLNSSIGNTR